MALREWGPEELIAAWTLLDGDWELVGNKDGGPGDVRRALGTARRVLVVLVVALALPLGAGAGRGRCPTGR
ncbi:hypothetical protein OG979_38995 [Actinomadura citrea]|uniref:hypothetical protein n=1 Tax=Actinomadura citrea TaxID=46158 RepID=UPI002E28E9FE|nr:hypothetical protein [Actinomadura citrea]